MKRIIYVIIFWMVWCGVPAFAQQTPKISAQSAILYAPDTGMVFYEKNADQPRGMASTTKIMTALVALEQYDVSQVVTIEKNWCGIEGSSMYLKAGEQLTISDLLYGLLLESGNDAATALAGLDPKGPEAFVQKMNDKAQALGLSHTHFDNPSGLDGETHYTTARELAQLTAYAMKDPVFADIVATRQKNLSDRTLTNHNRLLREIDACGVKTGYTKSCGRCLVSAKWQKDRLLICVTLNDSNDWADHQALYDWAFGQMQQYDLLGAGECGTVALVSSQRQQVHLYCNESYSFWLSPQEREQITASLCGPRFFYGTVRAGQLYGTLQFRLGKQVLMETPVYFSQNSEEILPETSWLAKLFHWIFRGRFD